MKKQYLQGFDQDGHVGLGDAQWEAKHGWDHDEADDQVQPDLHRPEGSCPEVLHLLHVVPWGVQEQSCGSDVVSSCSVCEEERCFISSGIRTLTKVDPSCVRYNQLSAHEGHVINKLNDNVNRINTPVNSIRSEDSAGHGTLPRNTRTLTPTTTITCNPANLNKSLNDPTVSELLYT